MTLQEAKHFSLASIPDGSTLLVIGKRHSSVTTLSCEIMYAMMRRSEIKIYYFARCSIFELDQLHCIEATAQSNIRFESLLNRVETVVKECCKTQNKVLLVFDCVLDATSYLHMRSLEQLCWNESRRNVTVVFAAVTMRYVPTWFMHRLNYVFQLKVDWQVWRDLWKHGWTPPYHRLQSNQLLNLQNNHGCIVIDGRDTATFQWYRARDDAIETFRRACIWPRLVYVAAALLESRVAPYVALDIVDFLLTDLIGDEYGETVVCNHFRKIKCIEAVQKILRRNGAGICNPWRSSHCDK